MSALYGIVIGDRSATDGTRQGSEALRTVAKDWNVAVEVQAVKVIGPDDRRPNGKTRKPLDEYPTKFNISINPLGYLHQNRERIDGPRFITVMQQEDGTYKVDVR